MLVKGISLQDWTVRGKEGRGEARSLPHRHAMLFFPPFLPQRPAGSQSWGEKGAEAGAEPHSCHSDCSQGLGQPHPPPPSPQPAVAWFT